MAARRGSTGARWIRFSRLVKATDDDVAVLEQIDATSTEQVRWLRSGAVFPAPGAGAPRLALRAGTMKPRMGRVGAPSRTALSELTDWPWTRAQTLRDGSTVWSAQEYGQPLLLLAVVNGDGAVRDVYGWRSADYVARLVEMGDGLFVGFSIQGAHAGLATDHLPFLIDLTTQSVHPLLGLPSGGPWPEPRHVIPLATE